MPADAFAPDQWLLVLNPISGRGRGTRHRGEIEALLAAEGMAWRTVVSEYAGHTTVLAADAVRVGCRRVLVAGGDGSLNEAVNGLFAQDAVSPDAVRLALLPVGTGNDWGRGHGLRRDARAAVALAARAEASRKRRPPSVIGWVDPGKAKPPHRKRRGGRIMSGMALRRRSLARAHAVIVAG